MSPVIRRTAEDIADQAKHELLMGLMLDFKARAEFARAELRPEASITYKEAAKLCQSRADDLLQMLLAKSVVRANEAVREGGEDS